MCAYNNAAPPIDPAAKDVDVETKGTKLNLLIPSRDAHRLSDVARRRRLFAPAGRYVGEPSRSLLVKGIARGEIVAIGPLTQAEWHEAVADLTEAWAQLPDDAPAARVLSQIVAEARFAAGLRLEA